MMKFVAAGSLALMATGAVAQSAAPVTGLSAPSFVALASDANTYAIQSARLAVSKAQRDDVKSYAKRVLEENATLQKSLVASLRTDSDGRRPAAAGRIVAMV